MVDSLVADDGSMVVDNMIVGDGSNVVDSLIVGDGSNVVDGSNDVDGSIVLDGLIVVDTRDSGDVSTPQSSAVKHSHSFASNVDSFSSKYNIHLISCCCFAFVKSSRNRKTRI